MPRIPTYTAEGKIPTQRVGNYPEPQINPGGVALTKSLNQAAGVADKIAGQQSNIEVLNEQQKYRESVINAKLAKQKDDADVLEARATYTRRVKETHLELVEDDNIRNNPQDYAKTFNERMQRVAEDLEGQSHLSPNAKKAFRHFFKIQSQEDGIEALAAERKLISSATLATIARTGTALVQESATMHPNKLKEYRGAYKDLVESAFRTGHIKDAEARDKLLKDFDDSILERNMIYWANQGSMGREVVREIDREGGWKELNTSRRAEILEGMRADEHKEEVRTEQVMNNAKQIMTEHLYSLAYRKELPQVLIDEIIADKNPLIKPQVGKALQEEMDKPAKTTNNKISDNAIRLVVTKFNGQKGRPTRAGAESAKAEIMNIITQNGGIVSDQAEQSLSYINSQLNVMESERLTNQSQVLQYGRDAFKASAPPRPIIELNPGAARNREMIDQAEIETKIRNSPKQTKEEADRIIKEHRDAQEKARKNRSERQQKADQLRRKP